MSLLTQELAEQELARSSIAEEADEWIQSEEEEELEHELASIAEEADEWIQTSRARRRRRTLGPTTRERSVAHAKVGTS
jgi:hypothetical protein